MDRELRRRVVQFLMKHIGDTAAERKANLENALHGCTVISKVGSRDANTDVFTSHLVDTLHTFGRCPDDTEPSLVVLIRFFGSPQQRGIDVQQQANALADDVLHYGDDRAKNTRL